MAIIKKLKFIIIFAVAFFALPTFASTQIAGGTVNDIVNESTQPKAVAQNFRFADYGDIDIIGIDFYYISSSTVDWVLCYEGLSNLDFSDTYTQGAYPNISLKCRFETEVMRGELQPSNDPSIAQRVVFEEYDILYDNYTLIVGNPNASTSIAVYTPAQQTDFYNNLIGVGPISQYDLNYGVSANLKFNLLYDDGVTNVDNWAQEWFTIDQDRSDFYTPISTVCLLGEDCRVSLYYNTLAIDKTFYIIEDNGQPIFPEYAIGNSTIPDTYLDEYIFTYPNNATTTSDVDYCVYLVDDDYGDIVKCGSQINWRDSSIYLNDIIDDNYCSEQRVCSDIDPDKAIYAFECALKRSLCWTFKPSIESIETFKRTVSNLENSFPFNTVFSILNYTGQNIEEKTSGGNAGGEFGVLMINENKELYTLNFIDQNTYTDTIGSTTTEFIETTADYIIWATLGFIIAFIILKYSILN